MALLRGISFAAAILLLSDSARASPWAEVGNGPLRSDIEILAAADLIDNVTMQWPLPWAAIVERLRKAPLDSQPAYVRAAAGRVLREAEHDVAPDTFRATVWLDGASSPDVVRSFDALGREDVQGGITAEYIGATTAVRLSLGAETLNHSATTTFVADNSYIAQKLGGMVVYAGYLSHWWGPGWVSSLSLSNNARPIPQIGIARAETTAFQSPWLSWIGPWQFEFYLGVLDGPRSARNTVFAATRVAFSPIDHLEIGFSRTTEMCGTGHVCVPLKDYLLAGGQTNAAPDNTNDEASYDLRYSNIFGGVPYEIYLQLMNEDNGPFVQSATSHLFGAGVWIPLGADRNPLRVTFEYADSLATANFFSFGKIDYGVAYNNGGYPDGMRYRNRTIGFSLDGDSRLLSLQGSWLDGNGWSYEFTFHHAKISDPLNTSINVVTAAPVTVNLGEAHVVIPLRHFQFELVGRYQDDQPRPDHGALASIEGAITYRF